MLKKTELLWTGSKYGSALLGKSGPSLQRGAEIIKASDHVRLLKVTISSDISLDKHVSTICSMCFCWLRQIRRMRRSLDTDSAAALVHALIASRVDYCNTVLAGAPRTITDRFQQVLKAAARVVSETRKFDRDLSQLPHSELHWLDIPQRVQYKLGVTVHRCLQNKAPQYMMEYCTPKAKSKAYYNTCKAPQVTYRDFRGAGTTQAIGGRATCIGCRPGPQTRASLTAKQPQAQSQPAV